MQRDPLQGWPRKIGHLLAILLGWGVFFYWWYLVAVRDWSRTEVALIIFFTLILAPVITLAWIYHNLNIFKRKGPRLGVAKVAIDYSRDWNQREVVADWERLADAGVVIVTVDGPRKRFSATTQALASPPPELVD